jgi:hypothetical protein
MTKKCATKVLLIIILLLCPAIGIKTVWADEIITATAPAPIILSTSQIEEAAGSQITVSGLTTPGNNLTVYINGDYYGLANINNLSLTLAKFSYISPVISPKLPLEVMVISQNQQTRLLSAPATAQVKSIIEKSLLQSNAPQEIIKPATGEKINPPTLLTPSSDNCVANLNISGTSDGGMAINIFIDNKLATTLTPNKSSTPVTFRFSPILNIDRGQHSLYAIAQDSEGRQSSKSNIVSFCISSPQIINATSSVAESTSTEAGDQESDSVTTASSSVFQETTSATHSLNNHKGVLNTIIFAIFIIGLLAWMLIINRGLKGDSIKQEEVPAAKDTVNKNNQQPSTENKKP